MKKGLLIGFVLFCLGAAYAVEDMSLLPKSAGMRLAISEINILLDTLKGFVNTNSGEISFAGNTKAKGYCFENGTCLSLDETSCPTGQLPYGLSKEGKLLCDTICTPTDGGLSDWSAWECLDETTLKRTRSCTNPVPSCTGAECDGELEETKACDPGLSCEEGACRLICTKDEDCPSDYDVCTENTCDITTRTCSYDNSPAGIPCDTQGGMCDGNGNCGACIPNCTGKTCGDDGCGGSCGSCGIGASCINNVCVNSCAAVDCKNVCRNDILYTDGYCKNGSCYYQNQSPCQYGCGAATGTCYIPKMCTTQSDCSQFDNLYRCDTSRGICLPVRTRVPRTRR